MENVLQICPLSDYLDARLEEDYKVIRLWEGDGVQGLSSQKRECITGLVTKAPLGVPDDLWNCLPSLRIVSSRGVGMDRIDLSRARSRGVQVAGTFGVLSDCVADAAFGLLIDVVRRISAADRYVRRGSWAAGSYPLTTRVSGKRLGIIGLGSIGSRVARRAAGFDMQIAYCNPRVVPDAGYLFVRDPVELAKWCDFLVVAVPGNKQTHHLVSDQLLAALGEDGYLINIARGTVVDEAALVRALEGGKIAGAGMDVFAHEPQVPEALLALDNVVLTPHFSSGTWETRRAMEDLVLENLSCFYEKGKVKTPAYR